MLYNQHNAIQFFFHSKYPESPFEIYIYIYTRTVHTHTHSTDYRVHTAVTAAQPHQCICTSYGRLKIIQLDIVVVQYIVCTMYDLYFRVYTQSILRSPAYCGLLLLLGRFFSYFVWFLYAEMSILVSKGNFTIHL